MDNEAEYTQEIATNWDDTGAAAQPFFFPQYLCSLITYCPVIIV